MLCAYDPDACALVRRVLLRTVSGWYGQKDGAAYVADINVLDGTRMQQGYTFTKTWRIRNTGSSSWGDGYQLVPVGSNSFGGPAAVALPAAEPGAEVDISIELTAPTTPGRHRSSWRPRSPGGAPFGEVLYVEIEVVRLGAYDDAAYLSDVTYPDGAVVPAGERMEKTWRIRNTGTSAWTSGPP